MAKEPPKKPRHFGDFKSLLKKVVQVPKSEVGDAPKLKRRKKK